MKPNWAGVAVATLLVAAMPQMAAAQGEDVRTYNIPAQDLASALKAFAAASGRDVVAPSETLEGKRSGQVVGELSPGQAIGLLLAGTGLSFRLVDGAFVVRPVLAADAGEPPSQGGEQIVVTGSRIRGAPVASPVIRITAESMRQEGELDLADVVRNIPQSFGGGQNPGVGANVPGASGINVGSATTMNLRGLGSDATLTLLNGHRLAYNGSRQGIDVSSIPIGIVDRIEIVAEGASALYGSDAVAGVANIILKRDMDGLETTADIGTSSEGGNFRQQYGALAGTRWSSGGLVAAYEFSRNTQIISDDRSYAASRPGVTLYPALRRHAVAFAGHQDLTGGLSFAVDAIFNKRWSRSDFPRNFAGDLDISRTEQHSTSRSLAIAPSLMLDAGDGWRLTLSGVYGEEQVRLRSDSLAGDAIVSSGSVCYCNVGHSTEFAADGPLFELPGGAAKLAAGVGYRYNLLDAFRGAGDVNNVRRSQDSYFAYGEINLPLVSEFQHVAGVAHLNLSGAVRYEHYPDIDSVATPKVGLIYAPVAGLEFKASWGRSFRAPTLFQQYQIRSALLYPATSLGGSGYPQNATALFILGGNPNLAPERAQTWAVTVELRPAIASGLRLQLGYFSTRYTDRIVTPISFQAQALSNPLYADRVTLAPGSSTVSATVADAAQFFNVSGLPYDPAAVVAIIDNGNVNAGRQRIEGIDLLADYRIPLGPEGGALTLGLNASYLTSDQQLTPGAPILPKAGTLFNPPRWRGRASVTWNTGPLTLNASASYVGGVDDVRSTPAVRVNSVTAVDLTANYGFQTSGGPLQGVDVRLTVQNLFNDGPDTIATTLYSDSAFDSTNYSPIGRFIAIGLRKRW